MTASLNIPSISVVMSCFNAERWLVECIESVLKQSFTDFELIIVDDGSTDGTSEIIEQAAAEDMRIVTIAKENTGLADSLNVGIAQARGAWIARIDADDLWERDRLALQWRAVVGSESLVFVGTGIVLIDGHGVPSGVFLYPTDHDRLVFSLTTLGPFPAHSSALFCADAFRRVGGYRPRVRRSEDWDLFLRLSEVGKLASLSFPLVQIRKHPTQISNDDGGREQWIDGYLAVVSYWLRQAGCPDPIAGTVVDFDAFRSWLVRRLVADCFFERQSILQSIKGAMSESLFRMVIQVATGLLAHPTWFARLGLERFRGSRFPEGLAAEWMRSQRVD